MPPAEYKQLANIIEAVGTPEFFHLFTNWIRSSVPFDLIAIVIYRGHGLPLHVHDDFREEAARKGLRQYLAQTYILNPFFQRHLHGLASGVYRVGELAPDRYLSSDVYKSYEVIVAEQEEIGYLTRDWPRGLEEVDIAVPLDAGETTEIGLYRAKHGGGFSDGMIARLQEMLPFIDVAFRQHWQRIKTRIVLDNSARTALAEEAFRSFGEGRLTGREREVMVMVLRGHSSDSVAANLDISRTTVKSHRKNAYEKLGISTQAELLSLFIDHVRARMEES
ncbi:helix-turn-helix transcriptional regulator [Labrys miyagiensis]